MHLALVTTSYPFGVPGQEAAGGFVEELAAEIATTVPVTVVAPGLGSSEERTGALTVVRFAVPRLPLSALDPRRPCQLIAIARTWWRGRQAVERVAAERHVTDLLALWVLPSGAWARHAARRHRLPFSSWALGSDILVLGRLPGARNLLRSVLRSSRVRFADGLALGREVERIAGLPCAFLPSCRSLPTLRQRLPSSGPPYRLAFIGRWHQTKGVDILLGALERLSDAWQRVEAVRVVGGGPLERLVHERVRALAETGRPVGCEPFADRQGVAALLDWCDWVLVPSRVESIPLLFSEAMQAGRGVVVAPVGDLAELTTRYGVGVVAGGVGEEPFAVALRAALAGDAARCGQATDRARATFNVVAVSATLLAALRQAGR